MYKYAQIINNSVAYIFEHEKSLEILKAEYFAPEVVLIDITNDNRQILEGWPIVNGIIQEPEPYLGPSKNERVAEIFAQYDKDRIQLERQLNDAVLVFQDGTYAADIRFQLTALDDKYITDVGAILNG